jgi:hypothetical protein
MHAYLCADQPWAGLPRFTRIWTMVAQQPHRQGEVNLAHVRCQQFLRTAGAMSPSGKPGVEPVVVTSTEIKIFFTFTPTS